MVELKMRIEKFRLVPELKVGIILLVILLVIAFLAPVIATYDPNYLSEDLLSKPSSKYIFGTDGLGKDVFSMVVYGARTSLKIGVLVAIISSTIGTMIGGISGYMGGKIDRLISEFLNMFMMLPTFFLILIVIAIYGSNINNMILVMALTSWTSTARLMRGEAIALRERNFIKSSRIIGESHVRILFKHIIPNGIFTVISHSTMIVSSAILSEAGLSFLGLGDPNVISWGKIISSGKIYLPDSWWICLFPGLAVVFTVFSFYLIGEGLNKILNPKLNVTN